MTDILIAPPAPMAGFGLPSTPMKVIIIDGDDPVPSSPIADHQDVASVPSTPAVDQAAGPPASGTPYSSLQGTPAGQSVSSPPKRKRLDPVLRIGAQGPLDGAYWSLSPSDSRRASRSTPARGGSDKENAAPPASTLAAADEAVGSAPSSPVHAAAVALEAPAADGSPRPLKARRVNPAELAAQLDGRFWAAPPKPRRSPFSASTSPLANAQDLSPAPRAPDTKRASSKSDGEEPDRAPQAEAEREAMVLSEPDVKPLPAPPAAGGQRVRLTDEQIAAVAEMKDESGFWINPALDGVYWKISYGPRARRAPSSVVEYDDGWIKHAAAPRRPRDDQPPTAEQLAARERQREARAAARVQLDAERAAAAADTRAYITTGRLVLDGAGQQRGRLFLGTVYAADNPEWLSSVQPLAVVNASNLPDRYWYHTAGAGQVPFVDMTLEDSTNQSLTEHHQFHQVLDFIHDALHAGRNVLVHCVQAKSRSPAIVVAYLMKKLRMGLDAAWQLVHRGNRGLSPNPTFAYELRQLARSLTQ